MLLLTYLLTYYKQNNLKLCISRILRHSGARNEVNPPIYITTPGHHMRHTGLRRAVIMSLPRCMSPAFKQSIRVQIAIRQTALQPRLNACSIVIHLSFSLWGRFGGGGAFSHPFKVVFCGWRTYGNRNFIFGLTFALYFTNFLLENFFTVSLKGCI